MITEILKNPCIKLGSLIKVYREKTGRNQTDVANAAGISTSMLSQIERGTVSPSIDTLFSVCSALDLDIAELFGKISDRTPVRILRQGQRLSTEKKGARYERLAASPDSRYPADMFVLELSPGCLAGLHGKGHEGVELGYVLKGTAILTVEETEYSITSGDSISFASAMSHSLRNDSTDVFKAVWTVMPPHVDYLEENQ